MKSIVRIGLAVGATVSSLPAASHADGVLEVVPVEGGLWAEQIARWQSVPTPSGASFHVRVVDRASGAARACGTYALQLDRDATRALRLGACNPADGSTEVVLVDRRALFAPGDPVATPRMIGIVASALEQTGTAGGAAPSAGVQFRCIASVRPYIADLLNGTYVYLDPDHFALEPLDAASQTQPSRDGWLISSRGQSATATAAFRVIDLRDGHEVTRSQVAMQCSVNDGGLAAPSDLAPVLSALHLPAGAVGRGSTEGSEPEQLSCTRAPAPTIVWRYTAPFDGAFEFVLQGGFDTALEVRASAEPTHSLGCSDDDRVATHSRVVAHLRRGESYDLHVSGQSGDSGGYEVAVLPIPGDLEVPTDTANARTVDPTE